LDVPSSTAVAGQTKSFTRKSAYRGWTGEVKLNKRLIGLKDKETGGGGGEVLKH